MPKDAKVDLIAVNLEEAPRQITSMLERHKMKLTVALDQDGAVAAKYAATAIPQTVIIDREGKIVRLFVGSSPQFEKELRAALAELLGPPSNGGPVTSPAAPQAD
jgi:peroxiredoxin